MDKLIAAVLMVALACLALHLGRLMPQRGPGRAGVFVLLLLAFGARFWLLDRVPSAEEDALLEAVAYFRSAGGFWGVRSYTGPFSIGVQYALALSALLPGSAYIFKYICFMADIVLAWGSQRCVESVAAKPLPRLWVFLLVLLLPSGILESSGGMARSLCWVFPALAAGSVLRGGYRSAGLLLGLSVLFHPGALWLLPVFWVFPALRENGWKSVVWIVGAYIVSLLPALLLGRQPGIIFPFWPGLNVFLSYSLSRGAPGIYVLVPKLSRAAGLGAYAILCGLVIYRLTGRDALHDRRRQLSGLCFGALGIGALLPGVPAAVLLGGEALLLALCALEPAMLPAGVLAALGSGLAAAELIFPGAVPLDLFWGAAAVLLAMALLLGNVLFRNK